MISSKELLEKTGLKSSKTLTRWHQQEIIPAPVIRTHPSGRGKMAYWPDSVLPFCQRLIELRGQGHSLHSAKLQVDRERLAQIEEAQKSEPTFTEFLNEQSVRLKNGDEVSLHELLLFNILKSSSDLLPNSDHRDTLIQKMMDGRSLDRAIELFLAGFNPVLVFDGQKVHISEDFIISPALAQDLSGGRPFIVFPLRNSLQCLLQESGFEVPESPIFNPAPTIWVTIEDRIEESRIFVTEFEKYFFTPSQKRIVMEKLNIKKQFKEKRENEEEC